MIPLETCQTAGRLRSSSAQEMFPQNVLHKYTARTYVYYDVIIQNDDIAAYIVVGDRPTTSQPSPGYLADNRMH